jgi:hypothetical protein
MANPDQSRNLLSPRAEKVGKVGKVGNDRTGKRKQATSSRTLNIMLPVKMSVQTSHPYVRAHGFF